ncbi:MAG TPA: PAS domain S-box protein [Solirubrobacteraceae bacterium]|nr:PAS domain S-box protein [Solirubrobacteraceae bacterium]
MSQESSELGLEAYRALYEHSPDGVLFTAPDGRVLAANSAACEVLGRTEVEICSLGRQGLADPADERWGGLVAERARAGLVEGIARMLRSDGTAIEAELMSRIFTDSTGEARACTVIRDVTARIALEQELANSRARLAEAERVASIGSWEWDLALDQTIWSDGLLRLYQLGRDEFDPTSAGAANRVYPGDRERVRSALDRAIEQRTSFTAEYRAMRADGRLRTFRSQGDVVVDDTGQPTRVVGVVQDITEVELARDMLTGASTDLQRRAAELTRLARPGSKEPTRLQASLTAKQFEILQLIGQGQTTAQIAQRLYLSEATIKWHVRQILAKTGASNRAEAIRRVLATGPDM